MPEPGESDGGAFASALRRKFETTMAETRPARAGQVPSVGRVVHFVHGTAHVPAFITDPAFTITDPLTRETLVAQHLTVFPVGAATFTTVAEHDAEARPGTWHWPEPVT